MTKEEMNKYAYELMVKNNPEEAVKQLLLKEKLQEENNYYFKKNNELSTLNTSLRSDRDTCKSRIDKAVEYIKKNTRTAPFENYKYLQIDDEEIEELLKLLKGE